LQLLNFFLLCDEGGRGGGGGTTTTMKEDRSQGMGYALIAFGLAFLLFVLVIALKPFLIFTVMGGYLLILIPAFELENYAQTPIYPHTDNL